LAALTTTQIAIGGANGALAAASAGGDTFNPDSRTFLDVNNGGASPVTVTIQAFGSGPGGNPVSNRAVVVPNATERLIGPFDPAGFADATNTAYITYSAVTSVTVGAFRL
jgi:hypothetical protein